MTDTSHGALAQDLRQPHHLDSTLKQVRTLYETEVAPREDALRHRLQDERQFLDNLALAAAQILIELIFEEPADLVGAVELLHHHQRGILG